MATAHQQNVKAMMQAFGQATPDSPVMVDASVRNSRLRLIAEEFLELVEACGMTMYVGTENGGMTAVMENVRFVQAVEPKLVEIADALADIQVVNTGTAVAFGIDLEPIVQVVDANNMEKINGGYLDTASGKFVKPENHPKPDIAGALAAQAIVVQPVQAEQREAVEVAIQAAEAVASEEPAASVAEEPDESAEA